MEWSWMTGRRDYHDLDHHVHCFVRPIRYTVIRSESKRKHLHGCHESICIAARNRQSMELGIFDVACFATRLADATAIEIGCRSAPGAVTEVKPEMNDVIAGDQQVAAFLGGKPTVGTWTWRNRWEATIQLADIAQHDSVLDLARAIRWSAFYDVVESNWET